jgi:hypothetical protein
MLTLQGTAIVDVRPDTPAGAALIGAMPAAAWANGEDWFIDPPASERRSA